VLTCHACRLLYASGSTASVGNNSFVQNLQTAFQTPNLIERIRANPRTAPFLAQPDFLQKLQELQQDSSKLQTYSTAASRGRGV